MAWPRSTHFGYGRDASAAGKKGGKARGARGKGRTPDWLLGYQAGWRASERWFRRRRLKGQAA
jgi:hypothetical protein